MRTAAFWLLPPVFCLWLYWFGLLSWFQRDDFAWLGLRLRVYDFSSLLHAVFAPMAQGTIRPWSERLFFMVFSSIFGLEALPYRICVFLTQFANLALLGSITRRLTGSWAAGLLASLLWVANPALSVPLSWTSAFNQILCGFFLLLAFHLFLRYTETGEKSYYYWQWAVFLLGFGALEINLVYPALAASYAFLYARKYFLRTLPMLPVSALYVVVHRLNAPEVVSPLYMMHWDLHMAGTFWKYWTWAFGVARLAELRPLPQWLVPAATALLTMALLGFALWKLRRGQPLGLFFLAWFVIVIAPVLPLRDNVSDYYLTLPTIGLAMLAGWAIASSRKAGRLLCAASIALAGVYLYGSLPVGRAVARWHYEQGRGIQTVVRGVERAQQLHPGKLILLNGVTNDVFWAGISDRPFGLVGAEQVYLVPGSETQIVPRPEYGPVGPFIAAPELARRALKHGLAVVYQVGPDKLRNITNHFTIWVVPTWPVSQPRHVDAGQKIFEDLFGGQWHPLEGSYRWMGKRGAVSIAGPQTEGEKLYLAGFCPKEQLREGPLNVKVTAGGVFLGSKTIQNAGQFELAYSLPSKLIGQERIEVVVEVPRTISTPSDTRELGLAFGTFSVR